MKRREWLEGASASLAALSIPAVLPGCDDGGPSGHSGCDPSDHPLPTGLPVYEYSGTPGPATMFSHGVVSGDPLDDSVILWTRVSPASETSLDVFYEVALDVEFTRRVAAATVTTTTAVDLTVKVDVTGLQPGVTYYYRFHAQGRTSPVGRTRTTPTGRVNRARFAVMSCSSLAHGYFHGYEFVSQRADLDAVIHLGDYIYEYGTNEYGTVRAYEPANETITLDDYRTRYKQYRSDLQLQAVHRQHPFICVWDDHEIADNTYADGAENHDPTTEGSFVVRRANAYQAYMEYMPIREKTDGSIYRSFAWGDLIDLLMLDTRSEGRSEQIVDLSTDDASRTMLGFEQESWFSTEMAASAARWVLVGQQVVVVPFTIDMSPAHVSSNKDGWDGYALARTRFLDTIEQHGAGRTVILTGDIHSSWANDVTRSPWDPAVYDPVTQAGTISVEFVTPGVTSPGFGDPGTGEDMFADLFRSVCPHMRWGNFIKKGYYLLDVTRQKVQADYYHLSSVTVPTGVTEEFVGGFATYHGDPKVVPMNGPETPPASCSLAP